MRFKSTFITWGGGFAVVTHLCVCCSAFFWPRRTHPGWTLISVRCCFRCILDTTRMAENTPWSSPSVKVWMLVSHSRPCAQCSTCVSWSSNSECPSLVAQLVKNPPAMQETLVQFQGWEDPLEKGTSTHSSVLAWRIPWTEEPGGLQSMRLQRVGQD